MLATSPVVATAGSPPAFCARLAPKLAMRPVAGPDGGTIWQAQTLDPVKAFLIGGSSMIAIGVGPADEPEPTVADYKRLSGSCTTIPKGARCIFNGPAQLRVRVKEREALLDATAGEAARVEVIGSRIRCEDGGGPAVTG